MNLSQNPAVLHLLCGKIAAGKSTLAAKLSAEPGTVLISEDAWLSTLFGDQMTTGADYLRCSIKLQSAMAPHVATLLTAGVSVVLDFAANTIEQRQWMGKVAQASGIASQLHFLDVPDDICRERLRARNASGDHEFAATEEQFHRFAAHFVPPSEAEGFEILRY